MFPSKSSSDINSKTNAFKNNFKENVFGNNVPERLEGSATVAKLSNEVALRPSPLSQTSSIFPSDQVPDYGAAHALVDVLATAADGLAVTTKMTMTNGSEAAETIDSMTMAAVAAKSKKVVVAAAGQQEEVLWCGRADPPEDLPLPMAKLSTSVISSSNCGTEEHPSPETSHRAQQGFNAMFASHLGSSNSLFSSSQSHTISFSTHSNTTSTINSTTNITFKDMAPTHISQSIRHPNIILSKKEKDEKENMPKDNSLEELRNPNFTNDTVLYQEKKMKKINNIPMKGPATNARWGIPPGLGLCGGGESSLTSGAATWGPAPTAATSGPPGSSGSGNNASSSGNPGSTGNSNANSSSNNNSTTSSSNSWGGGGVGSASAVTQNASQWGSSNNNNNRPGNNGNGNASTTAGQQNAGSSQGQGGLTNQGGSTVPGASSQTNPQGNSGTVQSNPSTAPGPASTSWAQAAGKNLPGGPSSSGGLGNNGPPGNGQNTGVNTVGGAGNVAGGSNGSSSTNPATGNSTKQQLEQLNSMREALFSQDGWGGQYVNQDTGWDIPNSPEPGLKDSATGGPGTSGGAGAGGGLPAWKPNVNNGTDLWEANLRNGGQPPPTQAQKTPWGHTPTTNIGGTWGEDDDVADSSNVWTGVPSGQQGGGGGGGAGGGGGPGSQWGGGGGPPQQAPMWGGGRVGPVGPKKENDWPGPGGGPVPGGSSAGVSATGGPAGAAGSSWATSAGAGGASGSLDPRPDPRELRGTGLMDPRDHMRGVVDPRDLRDLRAINNEATSAAVAAAAAAALMRGDTRGISGRLNGSNAVDPATAAATAAAAAAAAGMWGHPQQSSHHHAGGGHQPPGQGKMPGMPGTTSAGVNQWAPPPSKDLGLSGGGSKPSGWEEPSPPVQRRNLPNYDDGTSLWGNPTQQGGRMAGKVSHWKEMPTPNMGRGGSGGGGGMQCPPGIQQGRMPSGGNGQTIKQDNAPPLWSHLGDMRMLVSTNNRNGSWTDGGHDNGGNTGWGDDGKVVPGGINSWNDGSLGSGPSAGGGGGNSWGGGGSIGGPGPGGPKQKNQLNPGWVDGDMDVHSWAQPPKQGPKPLNKELIWASKQFRILVEMGYKKEDVENALRSSNMALEDALEQLNSRFGIDSWRRQEDQFDMAAVAAAAGGGHHPAAAAAAAAAAAGGFAGRGGFNPVAQPMPFAPPPPNQGQSAGGFNQGQRSAQNQPSTAQLRMLVQQIQMAVQAGYLNHQILNQPLAPQTLVLLNQLLQQIKMLQELMQRQTLLQVQAHKNTTPTTVLHISVQITKTKQQIQNLQNQIASQQAIFVKLQHQQQQQHHLAATQGHQQATGDFFKPNMHDPLGNFADLSINKEPQNTFQGSSRLPQWKLPAVDKEGIGEIGGEFSRAPGSAKPAGNSGGLPQSHASPNMNPLLGPGDGTWSTVTRSNSDTGWPDTTSSSNNDVAGEHKDPWPSSVGQVNSSASATFTDLVPEFEPGKPWKGNQIIKSIEDDPSITPGSVVRSPLSLANLKDSEIFNPGSKTSPTVSTVDPIAPMSLSSNTWSFNPPSSSSSSVFTSPLSKMGGKGMSMWSEAPQPTPVTSELWGAPMNKPRGPPPGLAGKGASAAAVAAAAAAAAAAGGSNASNGWGVLAGGGIRGGGGSSSGGGGPWSGMQQGGGNVPGGRGWLLLKNLTPQIDGSTLKTLCLQHGPLDSFHLYLNQGIALALYSSREEANKAQSALNNCVLSNTTIFTESPSESEVHSLLHHLGLAPSAQQSQQAPQPQGSGLQQGWGRGPSAAVAAAVAAAAAAAKGNGSQAPPTSNTDTWTSSSGGGGGSGGSSQLWPQTTSSASVLWGSGGLVDGGGSNSNAVDQHRATPSSLNSFLPGDLLGGESM